MICLDRAVHFWWVNPFELSCELNLRHDEVVVPLNWFDPCIQDDIAYGINMFSTNNNNNILRWMSWVTRETQIPSELKVESSSLEVGFYAK